MSRIAGPDLKVGSISYGDAVQEAAGRLRAARARAGSPPSQKAPQTAYILVVGAGGGMELKAKAETQRE